MFVNRNSGMGPERQGFSPKFWTSVGLGILLTCLVMVVGELGAGEESKQVRDLLEQGMRLRSREGHYGRGVSMRKAVSLFKQVLQIAPRNALAKREWGLCQIECGYFQGAINILRVAAKDDPKDWLIRAYLGKAHLDAGELKESLKAFEEARELNPGNRTINQRISEIGKKLAEAKGDQQGGSSPRKEPQNSAELKNDRYYLSGETEPFSGILYKRENIYGVKFEEHLEVASGTVVGRRKFRENGKPWSETRFVEGKEHGSARTWYDSGVLESEVEYSGGKKTSEKCWDRNGNPVPLEEVQGLECLRNLRVILGAVDMCEMDGKEAPSLDLDALLADRYLSSIPVCPRAGNYSLGSSEHELNRCSVHGTIEDLKEKYPRGSP